MSEKINWDDLSPEAQQALVEVLRGSEAGGVSPTEFQQMLGQVYYFLKDDVIERLFIGKDGDERLKSLLPGISHLIRTSRQDDDRIRAQMKLRWKRALRLQLLVLPEEVKMSDLALFDTLVNFGYSAIDDQKMGWRGKLAAERVKTYKIEGATSKRKSWLERFGFR